MDTFDLASGRLAEGAAVNRDGSENFVAPLQRVVVEQLYLVDWGQVHFELGGARVHFDRERTWHWSD